MRRVHFVCLASCLAASQAAAQFPPPGGRDPGMLPPGVISQKPLETPKQPQEATPSVGRDGLPVTRPDVALRRQENIKPLGKIDVKYMNNNWQVWAGPNVFKNFGNDWKSAEKTAGTLQAMQTGQPTEEPNKGKATISEMQLTGWATLGETRPVIGYMMARGEAVRSFVGGSNTAIALDLSSVHAEEVRGVWVVRDSQNILLNFGEERKEAEQAAAVAVRYGFNRIGYIGSTDSPSLRYFFSAADSNIARNPSMKPTATAIATALQEAALDRTGVEIPGFGVVGQKVNIDMRKMEIRKEGTDYILVSSGETFAKFGRDEWTARDALRILRDMKPTAIVRIGSPGITFFLNGNEVPNRLPFGMMGVPFEGEKMTIRQTLDGVFHIYEVNREIATVKSQKEAEAIKAAIKHFQLNRQCQIGTMQQNSLQFLGRSN